MKSGVALLPAVDPVIQEERSSRFAARIRRHFIAVGSLRRLTFPAISIDTGRRYLAQVVSLFGDTQIEDLPITYFCVSSNLSRARVLVHRAGALAKWVGASSSVPGIAPPLVEAGELIVDGGVLNNLPVDVARADGAGRVIAVDVSPKVDLLMPSTYFGRPGAWEMIRARLRERLGVSDPANCHYPSIFSLLLRASILSSIPLTAALHKHADLLIELPLGEFKLLDWSKMVEIVEVGRREAMGKLPSFMRFQELAAAVAPNETK